MCCKVDFRCVLNREQLNLDVFQRVDFRCMTDNCFGMFDFRVVVFSES